MSNNAVSSVHYEEKIVYDVVCIHLISQHIELTFKLFAYFDPTLLPLSFVQYEEILCQLHNLEKLRFDDFTQPTELSFELARLFALGLDLARRKELFNEYLLGF